MDQRPLGRTGLQVSALGFGCGSTGGLMVRGTAFDQERVVARAIDLGINYFDTAAMYGDGESETNLGRVLSKLGSEVIVASKTSAEPSGPGSIAKTIFASAEASLQRLRRERIDVFQLHTPVRIAGAGTGLDVQMVIEEVIPAFETLRQQGKIGFFGFSGTGDPAALPQLVETGAFDVAQVIYNALNPSAGSNFAGVGPNYGNVLTAISSAGMGAVAIRVLAAGALSGVGQRHPVASAEVYPMGSSADFRSDVALARGLSSLVRDGHVATMIEAALRFAISHPAISTTLVGFSDLEQLEEAAGVIKKGPLPPATLDRIAELLPRKA